MYICTGCHLIFSNINSLLEHRLGCEKSDDDDFTMILNSIFYSDDDDDDIVLQTELSLPVQADMNDLLLYIDNDNQADMIFGIFSRGLLCLLEHCLGCEKSDDDDFTMILNSIFYSDDDDEDIVLQAELSLPVQAYMNDLLLYIENDGQADMNDLLLYRRFYPCRRFSSYTTTLMMKAGDDLTDFLNSVLYDDSNDKGQWDDDIEVMDWDLKIMLSLPEEVLQADMEEIAMHLEDLLIYINDDQFIEVEWGMVQLEDLEEEDVEAAVQPTIGVVQLDNLEGCDEAGNDLTAFLNFVLYNDSDDEGQWDDDIEVLDSNLEVMLSLPKELLQAEMEEIVMHHEDLLIYVNDDQVIEVEWEWFSLKIWKKWILKPQSSRISPFKWLSLRIWKKQMLKLQSSPPL
ncbi:hypothetical protein Q3G72_005228 [Acer saccharum]|nr:hypothetical protein Q3G72_005228 [Acer saccharum]